MNKKTKTNLNPNSNPNSNQIDPNSEWVKKLGQSIIKDVEIKIGTQTVYSSYEDSDKDEKLKLLAEIDDFKKMGLDSGRTTNNIYLNSDINDIRFVHQILKTKYNKIQ